MSLTLKPVESAKSRLKPEEIDADVALAVEEAYKYLSEEGHDGERLEVDLGSKDKGDEFLHAARSYAYHREPRLVVTGNSFKTGARFRADLYTAPAKDSTPESETAAT